MRELENLVERAIALAPTDTITPSPPVTCRSISPPAGPSPDAIELPAEGFDFEAYL